MKKNCEKHGEYEPFKIVIGDTQTEIGCPMCHDEAVDAAMAETERQKDIAQEARYYKKLELMNIEPNYRFATFENYETVTDEQVKAVAIVRNLVAGKIHKVLMTGRNGTGKTHLACAAVLEIGGRILTMYEISTMIRASYTALADKTELQIVDDLARIPLLVIDEIGRTKGSETEANWLSYIIDKRHVRNLPLILISNKHVKKDCQKNGCPDCLENYIGDDIMSRLSENSSLLRFSGDDYRKKRK